jgi:murein DD-endopeptidase MepM/ murein hydrolase activator NlpD
MKRIKRFSWTFCIVTKQGVRQFTLRDIYLYLMLVLTTVLFLSTSLLTIRGIRTKALFAEYQGKLLVKEHSLGVLGKLGEEVRELKDEIALYASFDDKLRYAVDMGSVERNLRVMGIGGPSSIDTLKGKISRSSFAMVSELVKEVNFADQMVDLEQSSYEELFRKVNDIIDLKRHTPSIWPTHGSITSGFGYRRHPIKKSIEFHRGLDIANCVGTKIYATADGVVDFAGRQAGYGNYLSIDHGYGIKTKYGHLQRMLVAEGEVVKRGQLIATMGRTGYVTGSHLHYEVRILNNPVNPLNYIIRDTLTY